MDVSLAATDSGPLYTSVFYCGENVIFKPYFMYLEDLYYMVIGAHDSMILIINGGNAIYGAVLVPTSLVPRPDLEKINKHHVNVNCII